ncbi:Lycopene beta-cyclase [Microthyrium microscopicum]|uniref:Bifunctional lycopene cyclase/phytoene synthase n=1 Tax=Microthyrium microscopicum TaxID=703497 RepID=A0A6A6UE00_9PEZI|nr:Lycopene beta-cyclase [Microthyrium microscopicum]
MQTNAAPLLHFQKWRVVTAFSNLLCFPISLGSHTSREISKMSWDYALVHIKYTIPPAVLLTLVFWPLATRLDVQRVLILITIAVVSTIPWDSYLIRSSVWSYPPTAVIGPTLFSIPFEEVFFFIIQTYITSLLYLLLSRPVVHGAYLQVKQFAEPRSNSKTTHYFDSRKYGQVICSTVFLIGAGQIYGSRPQLYLGLILAWSSPFILLLWSVASQLILSIPRSASVLPIVVPTLYLWIVDTLALRRGTWCINHETKTGLFLWPHLEIEEAIFFFLTNVLVVFGQIAIDTTLAIIENTGNTNPCPSTLPGPVEIFNAIITPYTAFDDSRTAGLKDGVSRLKAKSRSFYLASAMFRGNLRNDLILLYSFCRAADDLVDEAGDSLQGSIWVKKLFIFLDMAYDSNVSSQTLHDWIWSELPTHVQSAFVALPVHCLEQQPLIDLIKGFEMDLRFDDYKDQQHSSNKATQIGKVGYDDGQDTSQWPIRTDMDLEIYGSLVAGTVAHLVMNLVFHHSDHNISSEDQAKVIKSASDMGTALQLVNIARDVQCDSQIGRVYLPLLALKDEGLQPRDVLEDANSEQVRRVRMKILSRSFEIYSNSKAAIDQIPPDARPGIKVAVESYMEIGRVLQAKIPSDHGEQKEGRATVPIGRRLWVAWKQMQQP